MIKLMKKMNDTKEKAISKMLTVGCKKKDGAVYWLEIVCAIIIFIIIIGIANKFDYSSLWGKCTAAFGNLIDKVTATWK